MPFLYLTEIFLAICFGWIVATQIVYPIINGRSLFPALRRETSNRLAKDNALDKRLETWLEAQRVYADAIKGYSGNWVPQVVTGGGSHP